MAGAYSRDADSIFGHTFLIYAPDDVERSFLLWTAIDFAADITDVKWYELYPKGIGGGFFSYYNTLLLYEKLESYKGSETRDIRFFPIKISETEFKRFKEKLAVSKDKPFPYKFFTYNCSHGTYQLLYDSLDDLPKRPTGIMAPLDVVNILHKENRLAEPLIIPTLREKIQTADDPLYAELEFMEWQNKQPIVRHNDQREQKMADMRHTATLRNVKKPKLFEQDKKWTAPHKNSRVEAGVINISEGYAWSVGFRPFLHDFTDNQHFYGGTSSFQLFSTYLNINNDYVKLYRLDALHIRSTPIHNRWFPSTAIDLYAGYVDEESRFNLGIGKSFYLHKKSKLALETLLYDSLRGGDNYIGIQTHLLTHTTGKLRGGALYEHLYNGFSDNLSQQMTLWGAIDLGEQWGLYIENEARNKQKPVWKVVVRWYF